MGRGDHRVKLRGYRIELSEVEDSLRAQPAVDRAVVLVSDKQAEEPRLVAYLTIRTGHASSAEALRHSLREVLPGHMIPAQFVVLDHLPLTPHGKIDRARLQELSAPVVNRAETEQPTTGTEALLAGIWREVFRADHIGLDSDFFELGGDSLVAVVVAAKVHAALEVEVSLRAFADYSKLAALARLIDDLAETNGAAELPPLIPVPREQPLPLSLLQERIWRYSGTPESSAGYVKAASLRVSGPLDVDAFRWSLERVVGRHEILRTIFVEKNGSPVQMIRPPGNVDVPLVDVSDEDDPDAAASAWLRKKALEPIDLKTGPLLRFWLVRTGLNQHQLLRVHHNIISDGLSWAVFFRDLGLFYEARRRGGAPPVLEKPALQYADFASWQRLCLQPGSQLYQEQLAWWERIMQRPLPSMNLPFMRPVPRPDACAEDGVISWGLPPDVAGALERLARESGTTFFTIRLAAFAALLAAESGQQEIMIGTHATNRNRVELQEMFGFFLNMVPLRLRYSQEQSFREWLHCVKRTVVDTQSRSAIPYEDLCEELRRRNIGPPNIQVIFGLSGHLPVAHFGGLEIAAHERANEKMPWGFSVSFDRQEEASFCRATFDARIYEPAGVSEFIERLLRLLDAASRAPGRAMALLLQDSQTAGRESNPGAAQRAKLPSTSPGAHSPRVTGT